MWLNEITKNYDKSEEEEKEENKIFENKNSWLKNMLIDLKNNPLLNPRIDFLIINGFITDLKKEWFKNENIKYDIFEIRNFLSNYEHINNLLIYFRENTLDFNKLLLKFKNNKYNFKYNEMDKNFKEINKNKKFNLDQIYEEDKSKNKINKNSLKKRLFLNQDNWKQFYYISDKKEYFFKCKWYTNVKIPFKTIVKNGELKFFQNKIVDSITIQKIIEVSNNLIKGWLILDRKIPLELKEKLEVKNKILKLELNKNYEIFLFNHKSLNNFYLKDFNIETSINSLDKILLYIILKKENILEYVSKSDLMNINTANVKKENNNYDFLINNKNNEIIYNNEIDLYKTNFNENDSKDEIINKISLILKNNSKYLNIFLLIIEDINTINLIFDHINNKNIEETFDYHFWLDNKSNLDCIIKKILLICNDKEYFKKLLNNISNIIELTNQLNK